jgi:hypothetical protein
MGPSPWPTRSICPVCDGRVGVGRPSVRGPRRSRYHPRGRVGQRAGRRRACPEPAQSQASVSTSSVTTGPGSRLQVRVLPGAPLMLKPAPAARKTSGGRCRRRSRTSVWTSAARAATATAGWSAVQRQGGLGGRQPLGGAGGALLATGGPLDQAGQADGTGGQRLRRAVAFQHRQVGLAELDGQRAGRQQLADQVLDAPLVGGGLAGEPIGRAHAAVQRRPGRILQPQRVQPGRVDNGSRARCRRRCRLPWRAATAPAAGRGPWRS